MLNPDMDVAGAIRFYGHFLDSEVSEWILQLTHLRLGE
jgi:hypothetical protein